MALGIGVLDSGYWMLDAGCFGCQVSGVGRQGWWILDAGFWILARQSLGEGGLDCGFWIDDALKVQSSKFKA